jgi:hypothetical protein
MGSFGQTGLKQKISCKCTGTFKDLASLGKMSRMSVPSTF